MEQSAAQAGRSVSVAIGGGELRVHVTNPGDTNLDTRRLDLRMRDKSTDMGVDWMWNEPRGMWIPAVMAALPDPRWVDAHERAEALQREVHAVRRQLRLALAVSGLDSIEHAELLESLVDVLRSGDGLAMVLQREVRWAASRGYGEPATVRARRLANALAATSVQ